MFKIYEEKGKERYHCKLSKPNLVDYFTINLEENIIIKDFSGLKYVPEGYFLRNKTSRRFCVKIKNIQPFLYELSKSNLWSWIQENENQLYIQNAEFITFRNVLSTVMIAPFKKKYNDNKISAILKHGKIFLYEAEEEDINEQYTNNVASKYRLQNYKRYLFVDEPGIIQPYLLHLNNAGFRKLFYEIFELRIGNHRVIYSMEVDGVYSEKPITNLDEIKLAIHTEGKLSFHRKKYAWKTRLLEKLDSSLEAWAQSKFSLTEHLVTANYLYEQESDEAERVCREITETKSEWRESLNNIKIINTDSLPRRCPRKWKPSRSLIFLNEFLNSVKKAINMVPLSERNSTVWTFKCTPNFEVIVECNKRD